MSVRENIELYGVQEDEQIIEILIDELGVAMHPRQADAYVLENLPLPDSLITALVDYLQAL